MSNPLSKLERWSKILEELPKDRPFFTFHY